MFLVGFCLGALAFGLTSPLVASAIFAGFVALFRLLAIVWPETWGVWRDPGLWPDRDAYNGNPPMPPDVDRQRGF